MIGCIVDTNLIYENREMILFVAGVLVASSAYLLQNFTLSPYLKYKNTVGDVRAKLRMHANVFGNDIEESKAQAAMDDFRELSCELERNYYGIGARWLLGLWLPGSNAMSDVCGLLIRLSNSAFDKSVNAATRCDKDTERIKVLLKIENKDA